SSVMSRSGLIAGCALLCGAVVAGQAPVPGGSARLAGAVTDGVTGRPIANAIVTLSGRGLPPIRVVVDPRGRFAFEDLPPGVYSVNATELGYAGGASGQSDPTGLGRPVDVAETPGTDVPLRLWKFGAIDGTVTNAAGDPLVSVEVRALRRALFGGQWRLTNA